MAISVESDSQMKWFQAIGLSRGSEISASEGDKCWSRAGLSRSEWGSGNKWVIWRGGSADAAHEIIGQYWLPSAFGALEVGCVEQWKLEKSEAHLLSISIQLGRYTTWKRTGEEKERDETRSFL